MAHPETSAPPDRRLDAIDALRERFPECAQRLMVALLPKGRGAHFATSAPRYRSWKPDKEPVTYTEYFAFCSALVERLLSDAGSDVGRLSDVAKAVERLRPEDRALVLNKLRSIAQSDVLDESGRNALWDSLRQTVAKHREFAHADWALPPEVVSEIDELARLLEPTDVARASMWLFTDYTPELPNFPRSANLAEYRQRLAQFRAEAIGRIEASDGLDRVIEVAMNAVRAEFVGASLAAAVGDRYVEKLLSIVGDEDARRSALAGAYFGALFHSHGDNGWDWLRGVLGSHATVDPETVSRLLLTTHSYPTAWHEADRRGDPVAERFWMSFSTLGLGRDFEHVEFVAERLMGVGRNAAALQFLDVYGPGADLPADEIAKLVARALRLLLSAHDDSEFNLLQQHDFDSFFEVLHNSIDAVGADEVAQLEWAYLPALGHDPHADALFQQMAANPAFFVEVLLSVFPPEAEGDRDYTDDQRRRADNAYRLLSSWTQPPGMSEGQLDAEQLNTWLDEVLRLLDEAGRLEIGLVYVGHVLVSAPADDGGWPPPVVRNLFESRQLQALEDGFHTEILNRRGVTKRGMEEGGAQELSLVAKFRSDADRYAARWPRTASVLRKVAQSYEYEAQRNDESAERFRRGLN